MKPHTIECYFNDYELYSKKSGNIFLSDYEVAKLFPSLHERVVDGEFAPKDIFYIEARQEEAPNFFKAEPLLKINYAEPEWGIIYNENKHHIFESSCSDYWFCINYMLGRNCIEIAMAKSKNDNPDF